MEERVIPMVQLGGRMWPMRIGHKVLQKFSAITRVGVDQMGTILGRYDIMMLLLWCIISEQDRSVKREQMDDWIDALPIKEWQKLMQQVGEGIAQSFPDEEDEEAEEDDAPAPGSGPDPTGADT
ncbi:MAG: hypothetical protein K6C12_03245 [Oscillospiraceae bacterium]|nr:hypothetical protein [Oscillospiraceae bacterium]